MKRASGKSNISIVKDYLAGNRPFTQLGYTGKEYRKEGEKWTDKSGIEWERKGNKDIRLTKTQGDLIREAIGEVLNCKQCKMSWKWASNLDQKFLSRTGYCQNCLVDYETKLRILGIYEIYERYRLASYELGSLRETKIKIEETLEYFEKTGGDIVKLAETEYDENIVWKNTNKDKIVADATEDLNKVKKLITSGNKLIKDYKKQYQDSVKKFDLPDIITK